MATSTQRPKAASRPSTRGGPEAAEAKRRAALKKANRRRREISTLKQDARSGRLGAAELLADPRAGEMEVLTVLSMLPRCTLRVALEALLVCRINGARHCGELSREEGEAIFAALLRAGPRKDVDRELDRALDAEGKHAPRAQFRPSEFAAARSALDCDPLLLRMVDRLVDAVRLYAQRDDGGVRARIVAEQFILYCNYRAKVASGEYPPPRLTGTPVLE